MKKKELSFAVSLSEFLQNPISVPNEVDNLVFKNQLQGKLIFTKVNKTFITSWKVQYANLKQGKQNFHYELQGKLIFNKVNKTFIMSCKVS